MSPMIYEPHPCKTPIHERPRPGSLWQCPECDKVWELDTRVRESTTTRTWRLVTDPRRTVALQKVNPMRGEPKTPALPPAMQEVLDAWTVPGRSPSYHYQMQTAVRAAMPVLGRALDTAAYHQRGRGRA